MTSPISRRTLVKGTAWATPVLATTTVIPAYAASQCRTTDASSGGTTGYYNNLSNKDGQGCDNQLVTFGAQQWVCGLPDGVTVERVTYLWHVQQRNGQNSSGPGIFYPNNSTSQYAGKVADPGTIAFPQANTQNGWQGFVTVDNFAGAYDFTDSAGNVVYSASQTWTLGMEWRKPNNTFGYDTADANSACGAVSAAAGCHNFTTGPSGRFPIQYNNMAIMTAANRNQNYWWAQRETKIYLSDGRVIEKTINATNNPPTNPTFCG